MNPRLQKIAELLAPEDKVQVTTPIRDEENYLGVICVDPVSVETPLSVEIPSWLLSGIEHALSAKLNSTGYDNIYDQLVDEVFQASDVPGPKRKLSKHARFNMTQDAIRRLTDLDAYPDMKIEHWLCFSNPVARISAPPRFWRAIVAAISDDDCFPEGFMDLKFPAGSTAENYRIKDFVEDIARIIYLFIHVNSNPIETTVNS